MGEDDRVMVSGEMPIISGVSGSYLGGDAPY